MSFEWKTILTVTVAGFFIWILILVGLVKVDRKLLSMKFGLLSIFLINLSLSAAASVVQLVILNWLNNLFTGFGFGYAIGFAIGACALGAISSSVFATALAKKRRLDGINNS